MRRFIVLLFIMMIPVSLQSQEIKFGFVEDQRILQQLPSVAEVQKILDQESALWDQRFKERQQMLEAYLDSVTATKLELDAARADTTQAAAEESTSQPQPDSTAASPDSAALADTTGQLVAAAGGTGTQVASRDTVTLLVQLERLERSLDQAKKEVVAFYHKIYGEDGVLNQRNTELSQSIFEKLSRVITETGEKNNISMVFDSSILLYIDQDLNLTSQVLEALGFGEQ